VRVFTTVAGLRCELERMQSTGKLGFVPTMGALHPGHDALIARAVAESDITVVSIFLNPLQFEPGADLEHYPRDLDADLERCEQLGAAITFIPDAAELYGPHLCAGERDNLTRVLPPASLLQTLCAPHRPGHFEGVTSVVLRLLSVVQPDCAYFGRKDAQQLAIIRRLVADLHVPTDIRAVDTVRAASGLAWSSRNQYLTPEQQRDATALWRGLRAARQSFAAGERERERLLGCARAELDAVASVRVEYAELVDPDSLVPLSRIERRGLLAVAGYLGATRLIDNVLLSTRRPVVAIDGPAGAGKSTVTRRVADRLGLTYLDTGAMYRAATWLLLDAGIPLDDEARAIDCLRRRAIDLLPDDNPERPARVCVGGKDVTQVIRSAEVTRQVSRVSALPAVRRELVARQRQWGDRGGVVAEGRDIGTFVFPDAELKIFLTASLGERARRRARELERAAAQGIDLTQLERDIASRDEQDRTRAVSPLAKADDAIKVLTDSLSIDAVVENIAQLYRDRLAPEMSS